MSSWPFLKLTKKDSRVDAEKKGNLEDPEFNKDLKDKKSGKKNLNFDQIKRTKLYKDCLEKDNQKTSETKFKIGDEDHSKFFTYKILFSNQFDYRHIVDNHNRLVEHMKSSLEEVLWTNHSQPTQVGSKSFYIPIVSVGGKYIPCIQVLCVEYGRKIGFHGIQIQTGLVCD